MGRILVLDDVLDSGTMVSKILERQGHQVNVFTEEAEALAFAADHQVDAAILDIRLKKMTGIEVLEELRIISPRTQVIMLTGYPTVQTAKQALNLGAVDYCIKPIDRDELEEKVAEALARTAGSTTPE